MLIYEDIKDNSFLSKAINQFSDELQVCSDSRKLSKENCFLSLYGENFDSINFIPEVINKGVTHILIEDRVENSKKLEELEVKNPNVLFIRVKNIFSFILELGLARSLRFQRSGGKLIALTGSNGKTTNKEMLKHLLSFLGEEKVHVTSGNLNNQIGVPLTLFGLKDSHEVAVIEMGTNFPGEIEVLAKCAAPSFGFITNIGHAHIEFLKSLDGVLEEKGALFRFIRDKSVNEKIFIRNCFDEKLSNLPKLDFVIDLNEKSLRVSERILEINFEGEWHRIENKNLLGEHQLINMGQCLLLLGNIFPQSRDSLFSLAENFAPPSMNRGELLKRGGFRFYLDAYNANPSSMKASLMSYQSFLKTQDMSFKESLFILGDMNELGADGPELHKEVASFLFAHGATEAVFIGRFSKFYDEGFNGRSHCFESVKDFENQFSRNDLKQKEIFVKGSRSLQLESIIDINW